jgi:hypothetical protein
VAPIAGKKFRPVQENDARDQAVRHPDRVAVAVEFETCFGRFLRSGAVEH